VSPRVAALSDGELDSGRVASEDGMLRGRRSTGRIALSSLRSVDSVGSRAGERGPRWRGGRGAGGRPWGGRGRGRGGSETSRRRRAREGGLGQARRVGRDVDILRRAAEGRRQIRARVLVDHDAADKRDVELGRDAAERARREPA
jgi:hypothetical protein